MPLLAQPPEPPDDDPGDRTPDTAADLIAALENLEAAGIEARAALKRWRTTHGH